VRCGDYTNSYRITSVKDRIRVLTLPIQFFKGGEMIRDWGAYRNNIYFTGHISFDETPTWIYILEAIVSSFCSLCNQKWLWWVHVYIHDPIFQLKWKKTKTITISLPVKFMLEKFPDSFDEGEYDQYINDPEEDEEFKEKVRKFQNKDKELYEEFMIIYKKIQDRNLNIDKMVRELTK